MEQPDLLELSGKLWKRRKDTLNHWCCWWIRNPAHQSWIGSFCLVFTTGFAHPKRWFSPRVSEPSTVWEAQTPIESNKKRGNLCGACSPFWKNPRDLITSWEWEHATWIRPAFRFGDWTPFAHHLRIWRLIPREKRKKGGGGEAHYFFILMTIPFQGERTGRDGNLACEGRPIPFFLSKGFWVKKRDRPRSIGSSAHHRPRQCISSVKFGLKVRGMCWNGSVNICCFVLVCVFFQFGFSKRIIYTTITPETLNNENGKITIL